MIRDPSRCTVSRVSASLLTHLGRAEWVVPSEDSYIGEWVSLAADLLGLAEVRADQRELMRLSPLCDAARFTTNLKNIYRGLASR